MSIIWVVAPRKLMMNKQMGKFLLIYEVILRNRVECAYLWIQHFILRLMKYISFMYVEHPGRTKRKLFVLLILVEFITFTVQTFYS